MSVMRKNLFCESKKLLKQVDDITSKTNSKKINFFLIIYFTNKERHSNINLIWDS